MPSSSAIPQPIGTRSAAQAAGMADEQAAGLSRRPPAHGPLAMHDLGGRLAALGREVQLRVEEAQQTACRAVQQLGRRVLAHQAQRPGALSLLASVSAGRSRGSRHAPVFGDLAYGIDVKARLAGVPVFTVAKKDNSEFVLVSGEGEADAAPRQLGLFFFNEADAAAMVAKIREQSPELAEQSHVTRLTLDRVYDFAVAPKEDTPAQGVSFRFMPDARQVRHALQLYREAGIRGQAFAGVPVFQAEGLTVKTEKQRYTPLFFSKEDLDAAVGNAHAHKERHRQATAKAHSQRAESDLAAAQSKLDSAEGEEGRAAAQQGLEKARAKSDKFRGRVAEAQEQPAAPPKVEVGCLEEVLAKMADADGRGEWGSVMFVPAGAISTPGPKELA